MALLPVCIFYSYTTYSPILINFTPEFWCLDKPEELNNCDVECQTGYEFNTTDLFTTAVTDNDWVCEDSWKAPLSQTFFFIGSFIGTLIFGYVADKCGRIKTLMITNLMVFIAGLATSFMTSALGLVGLSICRFVIGLAYPLHFNMSYMLMVELTESSKRSIVGNLSLALGLSIGGYQAYLAAYLKTWQRLNFAIYIQMLYIFALPWIIDESLRWLITHGKLDEALQVSLKMAKVNGKSPDQAKLETSIREMAEAKSIETSMWEAMKNYPTVRKRLLIMVLAVFFTFFLFFIHIFNITNLEMSILLSFTVSSIIEFPGDVAPIFGLEWFGRRWSWAVSLATSGIFMLVSSQEKAQNAFLWAMLGRLCITFAINCAQQLMLEMFPTEIRGQAASLCVTSGVIATILVPAVVYSSVLGDSIPFIIAGVVGLITSVLPLLLPETAKHDLLDTVKEAENFGKDQSFFEMPCLNKTRPNSQSSTCDANSA